MEIIGVVTPPKSETEAYAATNSRIDNIIAHNNDTEGNSELIDIRTGADGVTYQTAGKAVRYQFEKLNDSLSNVIIKSPNMANPNDFSLGSAIRQVDFETNAHGYIIENSTLYNTTGYIPVTANVPITVSPYRILIYCDTDKVRYASERYEATTISEITPTQDGYIIFCFRKAITQVFASVSSESTVYTDYGYTVSDFLEEYVTSYDKLYEKLNGKIVYNIGDSVADGAGNPIYENGVKVGYSSYADILANKYSMILTKYSTAGATLGWRSVSQANKRLNIITQVMDFCALGGSPDIIFIAGGINDTTNSISKGGMLENYQAIRDNTVDMLGADLTDTTVKPTVNFTNPSHNLDIDTTCGAFEWCISMLRYYFPNAIIVYIREHIMGSKSWEQKTYQDEIENCCNKYGVAIVKTELNTYFYSSFTDVDGHREYTGGMADYTSDSNNVYHDGTHPNQLGYEKYYLPPIEECLRYLIK